MHTKKKMPVKSMAALLIIMLGVFYLISGICNVPDLNIGNLEESLIYSFTHPLEAWNDKTVAFLGMGFLIWGWMVTYYLQYHRNFHTDAFGSDTWRDVHEANAFYKDENPLNNRRITQNLQISLETGLSNNNMGVFASSGSFKTTGLIEQNLLNFASTYIVLDVKGELIRRWGNAFIKHGYTLKTIDFKTPEKSDQYNPFANIETEADVLRIAASILDACRPKKEISAADPFWDDAVLLYSQCLYFAEWLRARDQGRVGTMNGVMELSRWESEVVGADDNGKPVTRLQAYMEELVREHDMDYPPARDYFKLKKGAEETVGSVILMLNGMLNICETAEVKRIFEGNDIDLRELGTGIGGDKNKRVVVFLCIPDENPVYNWIVSLFYTQCMSILSRLSDDEVGGPLPVRVEFFLDELYAGCRPADLEKLLGIIRGRNISMILILQSIAQLQAFYPDPKWKIVMDNLAVVLYMGSGPGAVETHEYFSKALGNETIDLMNDSANFGNNPHSGLNFSQQKRELMTPTEIKRMSTKEAIVLIEASQPIYDKKAIPFDTKDGEYKAPDFLKKPYFENRGYGAYEHPVYTVYDPINFKYITIKKDKPFQVYTDQREIESLQKEAEKNKDIYVFTVDEDELLYLSWGKPNYTQENIEQIYQKAIEEEIIQKEKMKSLIVFQNVENNGFFEPFETQEKESEVDKSKWGECKTLKSLMEEHWDDLSYPEQEELSICFDDGLTEEQIRMVMLKPLVEMSNLRRIYNLQNQKN